MSIIDTKSTSSVALEVQRLFHEMFPKAQARWQETLFRDTETFYGGGHPDYLPCDLRYHDLEHTLQATLCYSRLIAGRCKVRETPKIGPEQFELGLAAMLLHDIGYLKLRSDTAGTGAKYGYIHVLRSCSFAASYLPTLGVPLMEVQGVLGAINCTGPTSEVARMHFRDPIERMIGCAVATGDYLGQMAAPDYPDELDILYREFEESYDYTHVPKSSRSFKSALDLNQRTPDFWTRVVLPKLEDNFQGMYRYLAQPYPDGPNPYLEDVGKNIAKIKQGSTVDREKK